MHMHTWIFNYKYTIVWQYETLNKNGEHLTNAKTHVAKVYLQILVVLQLCTIKLISILYCINPIG